MALGQVLKEARESKDLTVSEVAVITRMTSQIVSEIEKEDFHRFTAGLYWRSYIKLYAETMNVDPEPLLEEFMVLFNGKAKTKATEQKPTPVKKRDFNIFPTGETALEKIDKKKISDNLDGYKEKMESFNKKAGPALKKASSKAVATSKQLLVKLSGGFKKLSELKPVYLYSALGVVVGVIIITIAVSSFKSYRKNNPKTINEVVVTDVRAGIEVPEPYFDN
ncbi:MAG: helix-turn-helix domain-containing protein [Kiritimatiellae bacterium]|jgi:transcriptional regulator with XRE-family HTH domain|nr:helix-turn-helix domain-containing protein [Kiritimatiellia bacterium]